MYHSSNICVYYKENDEVKNQSIIIISECSEHDITAVYLSQKKLVQYLRRERIFASTEKISFFSDGAASQYKNRKNFLNLCLIKKDFGLEAEWHFFATSHGKSPCDALGGSFKRNARNRTMQKPMDPIDNAKKFYDFGVSIKDSKVEFVYCSQVEHDEVETEYKDRFDQAKTIQGTQSLHAFKPIGEHRVSARIYSEAEESKIYDLL